MGILAMVVTVMLTSNVADQPKTPAIKMETSWYGKELKGHLMANGEPFSPEDDSIAAHKVLPFGTRLRISNPNRTDLKPIVVKVQDLGPFSGDRALDLSEAAAKKIGLKGVETLDVEILIG